MGRFWTGFGIGIGLCGIALAIILWVLVPCPPPELPEAKITAVRFENGEITNFQPTISTPRELSIIGESLSIPSDWTVWISVFPTDVHRYYPQYEPVSNKGIWQLDHVCLGRENSDDVGKIFLIDLIVADIEATKQLNMYAKEIYGGIAELPRGAVICDQVTVIRND